MNAKKKQNSSFSVKKHSRKKDAKYTIIIDDKIIEQKTNVKYLGVVLDQFLTFQDEIKNILRKMACGIKTLNNNIRPIKRKKNMTNPITPITNSNKNYQL